jgi:hypothetical protein
LAVEQDLPALLAPQPQPALQPLQQPRAEVASTLAELPPPKHLLPRQLWIPHLA